MTGTDERAELRRAMGEASALPSGDPTREAVEARIAAAGDWAREEWSALLEEAAALRRELAHVPTPPGLEERLRQIPDELAGRGAGWPWRRVMAAAAGIVLVIAAGWGWHLDRERVLDGHLEAVSLLALDDHVNDREVELATSDPTDLCDRLAQRTAIPVTLPPLGRDFRLHGGRKARWGDSEIVYSDWERSGAVYSLTQFVADEFDLPETMSPRIICCLRPGIGGQPTDVLIWTVAGRGFALVGPHAGVQSLEIIPETL